MSKKKFDPVKEPRDLPREMLGWIVAAFVDEEGLQKSERCFYADEVGARMPEGKAVKVTFEYVEAATCGTCGGVLPI